VDYLGFVWTGMDMEAFRSCVYGLQRTYLDAAWRSTDQEVGSVEEGSGRGLALLVSGGLYELVILPIWLIEKGFRPPVVSAV
jgi:hypothetical protein